MAGPYYQGSGGSDVADGLSWANRFLTYQKLLDTVVAGEIGYTNGDIVSTTPVIDTNSGSALSPITIAGCDNTGTPYNDNGRATITTTTGSIAAITAIETTFSHYTFRDIVFDGGGSGYATHCFETRTSYVVDGLVFRNCRFTNASSDGIDAYVRPDATTPWTFKYCEIDNNGKGGAGSGIINNTVNSRCCMNLIKTDIHDNADNGFLSGIANVNINIMILGCNFYKNGNCGLYLLGTGSAHIINNVFYGNVDGLSLYSGSIAIIHSLENNIIVGNSGYGINTLGNANAIRLASHNCYYNNTTDDCDVGILGSDNVTADPMFVSTTAGSEDFRLQSGSPCKNTGIGYNG